MPAENSKQLTGHLCGSHPSRGFCSGSPQAAPKVSVGSFPGLRTTYWVMWLLRVMDYGLCFLAVCWLESVWRPWRGQPLLTFLGLGSFFKASGGLSRCTLLEHRWGDACDYGGHLSPFCVLLAGRERNQRFFPTSRGQTGVAQVMTTSPGFCLLQRARGKSWVAGEALCHVTSPVCGRCH